MATDLELVRYLIDDTDLENQLVTDEEIEAWLTTRGSVGSAAATIAEKLAARFARQLSVTIDGLSVNGATIADSYRKLAQRLSSGSFGGIGSVGLPVVSGVSVGAMEGVEENTDRVEDRFSVGQDMSSNPSDLTSQ